jgi:hypothetical protein
MSSGEIDKKSLGALLTGLAKRILYNDDSFTNAAIIEAVFGDAAAPAAAATALLDVLDADIRTAAYESWTAAQAEAKLRERAALSAEHQAAFVGWWKGEAKKAHDARIAAASIERTLHKSSWRIDVNSSTKSGVSVKEPRVIMELELARGPKDRPVDKETMRFNMNKQDVAMFLSAVADIEQIALPQK